MSLHRPQLIAPPGMCDTHVHFYDTSIPSAPADNKPDDADLLDLLLDWAPDDATRRRILADNPAELFGYPKPVHPS
jgi:predicted TIM-barrel fold metal-dependent hydrolase